ncbi:MAG TPA: hypothetical protein VFT32_08730 [Candidatus Eisenbacteria bacterium]|nr:hypothetical protein [Candidatus Eisenbacteria bacterium]
MIQTPGRPTAAGLLGGAGIALFAMLVVAAPPADAGIGNPIKKAKEKLQKKAEEKAVVDEATPEAITDETVVFDDLVLELTEPRLERIAAAFHAAKEAGAGREAAVEKLNQAINARGEHQDKHADAMMEVRNKRGEIEACLHEGYQEAQDRKTEEYSRKALNDPAIREKFMQVAMKQNEAAARGDSAAIKEINAVLMSETMIGHEDSVAVQKKCGPVPPPTPAEIKMADLDKQVAARTEELRVIDMKVAEAQAKEVQMEKEQFAMATERIQMYLAWKRSKSKSTSSPRGFTQEEIDAMEKHLAELQAAMK